MVNHMINIIITIEIVCAAFMLIVLFASIFESQMKLLKSKIFISVVCCEIFSLVVDCLSWTFEGKAGSESFLYIFNILSCICGEILITLFLYYLTAFLNEKRNFSYVYAHAAAVFNALGIIYTLVAAFTGHLFQIENGYTVELELYGTIGITSLVSLIYALVVVFINLKVAGYHDGLALIIYLAIPLIAFVAEKLIPDSSFSLSSCSLSIAIAYVMLQSEEVSNSRLREKQINEIAITDFLTSLKNRRAFMDDIGSLSDTNIGVIFNDINGLKYTNDTMGHIAGDDLIINYAALLKKQFSEASIYRVAGDEFVVLLSDISKKEFEEQYQKYRRSLASHAHIASSGAAHGHSSSINELLVEAENLMYQDKKEFYQNKDRHYNPSGCAGDFQKEGTL